MLVRILCTSVLESSTMRTVQSSWRCARGQDLLEEMRERPVAEVVEQRRGERFACALRRDALPERKLVLNVSQARDEALHHERRADGVRKSRVVRARVGERREAELANAPEPLNLRRLEQANDDRLLCRLEGDEPVDRIAKNHGRTVVGPRA